MRYKKLFIIFLFFFLKAGDAPVLIPASSLAPQSYSHDKKAYFDSFVIPVYEELQTIHLRLFDPDYSTRKLTFPLPEHPYFKIDPTSFFAIKHQNDLIEVTFRYTDVKSQKQFLIQTLIFSKDSSQLQKAQQANANFYPITIQNKELIFRVDEFPLRDFSTLKEDVTFVFKKEDSFQDQGQVKGRPPRIGNHQEIISNILSNPEFMQETLTHIYTIGEYSLAPIVARPWSIQEIKSLKVTEDDTGSQKQTYRVDLEMINGQKLDPFALKIGINITTCAKFREEELKNLQELRETKTVPVFGDEAYVSAFEISEENKKTYDAYRTEREPPDQPADYTVHVYSEKFVEGVTFGNSLNLVYRNSLEKYKTEILYKLLDIHKKAKKTQQSPEALLAKIPPSAIEKKRQEIEKMMHAGDPKHLLDLKIDPNDYLIEPSQFNQTLATWIKAALFLNPKFKAQKNSPFKFIKDMQRHNIMFTLLHPKEPNVQFSKYLLTDSRVLESTIVDVGKITEENLSSFFVSLFKYYYSYFSARSDPALDNKDILFKMLEKTNQSRFAFSIQTELKNALDSRPEAVRYIETAFQELQEDPDIQKFLRTKSSVDDFVKNLLKTKSDQSNKFFWKLITFSALEELTFSLDSIKKMNSIKETTPPPQNIEVSL